MSRIYELFFDKYTWQKRVSYLVLGFIIAPLIIGLFTATKCEFQKYQVSEEGVYGIK